MPQLCYTNTYVFIVDVVVTYSLLHRNVTRCITASAASDGCQMFAAKDIYLLFPILLGLCAIHIHMHTPTIPTPTYTHFAVTLLRSDTDFPY